MLLWGMNIVLKLQWVCYFTNILKLEWVNYFVNMFLSYNGSTNLPTLFLCYCGSNTLQRLNPVTLGHIVLTTLSFIIVSERLYKNILMLEWASYFESYSYVTVGQLLCKFYS